MILHELRDLTEARNYVLQGLWVQHICKPSNTTVKPILEIALEFLASGEPAPPIGVLADLAHLVFGSDPSLQQKEPLLLAGWPADLSRNYEDHFLGKLYADWSFERATEALRRYSLKDRPRGLLYVWQRMRERGKLGGFECSAAVVRSMLNLKPQDLLNEGAELILANGVLPIFQTQYQELIHAARRLNEVLGPEDVIALEQRTALADLSEYVAHRQILQYTARLEATLPARPVKPLSGRKEVPTRIHDEDQYPVGGYTSISNRGSIESLLHSQLAFMEDEESPDLFDMKFVRDELFYYSRDENQFLRRRRVFGLVFDPTMASARFKDAALPCQRIVLACSAALAIIRRIAEWLSTDALQFELLFVKHDGKQLLEDEFKLFEILLKELIDRGVARVSQPENLDEVRQWAELQTRVAQVQLMLMSSLPQFPEPEGTVRTVLQVAGPLPELFDSRNDAILIEATDPIDAWAEAVLTILGIWV